MMEALTSVTIYSKNLMKKHDVEHKIATPYHPQTNEQVEVSNRELKRILEKTVQSSRKDLCQALVTRLPARRRRRA